MGCDFFWEGHVADPELQKKAIYFIRQYFKDPSDVTYFEPKPDLLLPTLFDGENEDRFEEAYPFNFFGLAMSFDWDDSNMRERWQFVFDRTAGGRMVSILETPETIAKYGQELSYAPEKYQVRVRTGGHDRYDGGGGLFALMLNVVRLRYAEDLWAGDDYDIYKSIKRDIEAWNLAMFLQGETEGPDQCYDIYYREFLRRKQAAKR